MYVEELAKYCFKLKNLAEFGPLSELSYILSPYNKELRNWGIWKKLSISRGTMID